MKKTEMYDINAESMVLATLVFHPDYSASSEKLLPEYFHDRFNSAIYYGICELYKTKIKNIDFASLDVVIKKKYGSDVLNQAQCADFLDMANNFARDSLEDYMLFVNRIITCAYKIELVRKTEEIQRTCYKEGTEILDVQEKMRELTMQLTEKFSVGNDDPVFGDVIQDMWESSRKRLLENGGAGLPFKFSKLNNYCTMEPSELIVVAAQRKAGKSAFLLSEALNQIEQNKKVLYLDTELRSSQFMERIISNKGKIDNRSLKNDKLDELEKDRLSETIGWFSKNKTFTHIYRSNWNQEQIFSAVLYWTQKWGGKIDLLIYDYMKSSGEVGASEVYNSLGNLTNFLKNDIAGGFNIPVLAAAQMNRGGDIGDSYKIEQYASVILNLNKKTEKEVQNDNDLGCGSLGNYRISVKCNRLGEAHDIGEYIDLNFVGNHFDFQDVPNSPISHPKATPYDN